MAARAWPPEVGGFIEFLNGALAISPKERLTPHAAIDVLADVPKWPRRVDGTMQPLEGPRGDVEFPGHKGRFAVREGMLQPKVRGPPWPGR